MTLTEKVARELCLWECGDKSKIMLKQFFEDDKDAYMSEAARIIKIVIGGSHEQSI